MLPDCPEGDGHVPGAIYASSGTIHASSYSYICVRILIHVSSSYARVRAHRSEGEHEALSYWVLEHVSLSMWPYCLVGPLMLVYVLVLVVLLLFLLLCITAERVTEF